MDYRSGKPEDFFSSPFFLAVSAIPSPRSREENGPGKWRLQVETFARRAQRSNFTRRPAAVHTSQHTTTTPLPRSWSIWVLLMCGRNGHTGIQIPKLLWNLRRRNTRARPERMKRVCRSKMNKKKKISFDQFVRSLCIVCMCVCVYYRLALVELRPFFPAGTL